VGQQLVIEWLVHRTIERKAFLNVCQGGGKLAEVVTRICTGVVAEHSHGYVALTLALFSHFCAKLLRAPQVGAAHIKLELALQSEEEFAPTVQGCREVVCPNVSLAHLLGAPTSNCD